MTALATSRSTSTRDPKLRSMPVAASTTIYEGSLVMADAAGRAKPAAAGTVGLIVQGYAKTGADNSSGSAGDLSVTIGTDVALFGNSATTDAITIADRGKPCWAADDQTVARTQGTGTRPLAGIVEDVDADGVWVRFAFAPLGSDEYGLAGADLSAKQYYCVKKDTNGAYVLAALGAIGGVGVLMNAPASGETAIVRRVGQAMVVTAGTISKGAPFTSDANGKAVAIVLGKTDTSDAGAAADPLIGSMTLGDMQTTTGIADTPTPCFVLPRGVSPTTGA